MDFATFSTAVLVATAIMTGQNLIRFLRGRDLNGLLAIVLAWAMGFGVAEWMAHASVTASLTLITGAAPLGKLDFGSLLLLGLGLGSVAPVSVDLIKAFDNTQSAAKPKLVPPKS